MREYVTQKIVRVKTSITKSKFWQRIKNEYPVAHHFILSRITLKDFSGLPATLLFFAISFNLLLLSSITEDVINDKTFITLDNRVSKKLFSIRSETLANFFYIITQLGRVGVVVIISIASILISLWRKKPHFLIPIFISVAGCGLTMWLGKNIFKIQRPHGWAYYQVDSYAFPSGHSAIAVALYGLLFYFFIRHNYSFRIRMALTFSAVLLAFLIGFSRLYLCVHYLSDVLVGLMLGGFWLMLSISILEWEQYKRLKKKPVGYI